MRKSRILFLIATFGAVAYVLWRWQRERLTALDQAFSKVMEESKNANREMAAPTTMRAAPSVSFSDPSSETTATTSEGEPAKPKRRVIATKVHRGEPPKLQQASQPHFGQAKFSSAPSGESATSETITDSQELETTAVPETIAEPQEPVVPAPPKEPDVQAEPSEVGEQSVVQEEAETSSDVGETASEEQSGEATDVVAEAAETTETDVAAETTETDEEETTEDTSDSTDEKDSASTDESSDDETEKSEPKPKKTTRSNRGGGKRRSRSTAKDKS